LALQPGTKFFPYIQFETLNLRNRQDLQDMLEIKNIITQNKELEQVTAQLDATALEGLSNNFVQDLDWRSNHLGLDLHYSQLVSRDFPRQLSHSLPRHYLSSHNLSFSPLTDMHDTHAIDEQVIATFPFYRNAQLVRNPFRCFHRADGGCCSSLFCITTND
jgi:hypothetical protein